MLNKLVKYDLKAGRRIFGAMYLFIMICAVIARIMAALGGIESMDSNGSVFFYFYAGSFFLMILSIVVSCTITVVWIILRYRNNLLRDEGYLMHTLPVTPVSLYFGKMTSSIIWFLADIIVIFAAFIISGLPKVLGIGWDDFVRFRINMGKSVYYINGSIFILLFAVLLFIALYMTLAQIFASLNIGYVLPFGKGSSRDLMSIVVYIITYIIMQIIGFITVVVTAFISIGQSGFELMNEEALIQYVYGMFGACMIVFIIISFIYSTISIKLMQKKLDLE